MLKLKGVKRTTRPIKLIDHQQTREDLLAITLEWAEMQPDFLDINRQKIQRMLVLYECLK